MSLAITLAKTYIRSPEGRSQKPNSLESGPKAWRSNLAKPRARGLVEYHIVGSGAPRKEQRKTNTTNKKLVRPKGKTAEPLCQNETGLTGRQAPLPYPPSFDPLLVAYIDD